ncbi:uncharacterized protein GIQ15_06705 [Arthroderma uncinatum]|uniref:uncharacterized protein n=1 Tax=Arthroderma uncinatum TaxID=74035 RepID=UPI00144A75E5|nr:uncharacterized protein GIQ15_06705 [Arthroderma uncinatum]KAF3479729.1 hypothetical protein GIQ15_06705 [Arthroderma uncinatum]
MNRPNSPRLSIVSADSPRKKGPSSPRPQQQFPTEQAAGNTREPLSLIDRPVPSKAPVSQSRPTQVDQGTQIAEDAFEDTPAPFHAPGIEPDKSGKLQTDERVTRQTADRYSPPTHTGELHMDDGSDTHKIGSPASTTLVRRPSTVLELQEEAENDTPNKQPVFYPTRDSSRQYQPSQPERRELVSDEDSASTPKAEVPTHFQQNKIQEEPRSLAQGPVAFPQSTVKERPHSLSPNRFTRFSEQLEIPESQKHLHHPPPRSVSPAKPALKSTSNSPFAARPEKLSCQWGKAGSETSDGTSLISDDGSRAGWKKKHAKVSFEDETEVIGHVPSPPTSPESPTPSSPRTHASSRPWNDSLTRTKPRGDDSNEFEQFYTPRPALPSFGSIRGRKSSSTGDMGADSKLGTGATPSPADHAIGELISTYNLRNRAGREDIKSNAPLPPVVTSLEGTGYSSLSEDSSSDEGADLRCFPPRVDSMNVQSTSRSLPTTETGTAQQHQTEASQGGSRLSPTPAIFIQPATPAMEEVAYHEQPSSQVPTASNCVPNTGTQSDQPKNSAYHQTKDAKSSDQVEEDEDSESGNSVYSDAYEDLSDMDGDGFGSIDAIVDKSVGPAPEPQHSNQLHPLAEENEQREATIEPDVARDSPRAAETVPQSRQRHTTHDQQSSPYRPSEAAERYAKHSNMQPLADPPKPSGRPLFEDYPTNNSTATHPSGLNIHSSGQFDHRSPTLRPIQESNGVDEQKPVHTRHKAAQGQQPRRTMSNASDSSSSFKRPKRFRPTGRYTLRRTMRVGSPNNSMEVLSDGGLPSKAFDYSLKHRPFSSDSRPAMRTTLRQAPSASTSRFSALTGRGKTAKTNSFPRKPHKPGLEKAFRSRYEDSSDEEGEAIKLRPVRGIPRRKNEVEGDSTDLDDSSEYETTRHVLRRKRSSRPNSKSNQDPAIAAAIAKIMATKDIENATASANHDHAIDPNVKQKGGLFSRLHLSKHKPRHRDSMIRKPELESDTRKDTPLERSEQAENAPPPVPHDAFSKPTITTSVNGRILEPSGSDWQSIAPKLQKRSSKMSQRPVSDSWPLRSNGHTAFAQPPSPSVVDKNKSTAIPLQDISNGKDSRPRPTTSDGMVTENKSQQINEPEAPSTPLSPSRGEKSAWTSRFRSSRRGADDTPTASAISDVNLSSLRTDGPKREKKGRFPKLKKAFGIA